MLGFAKRGSRGGENAVEQPVLRGKALLAEHRARLRSIRAIVGVPEQHWRWLYQALFVEFAETVQRLPASEAHHHCEAGGLLRHALEVVELALGRTPPWRTGRRCCTTLVRLWRINVLCYRAATVYPSACGVRGSDR